MLYFDSSLVVSLMSSEVRTAELQQWFSGLDPGGLCLSDWVRTEFYSAMSLKRRPGQLSVDQRRRAELVFNRYAGAYFKTLKIPSAHCRRAASIAGREDINIRAADALHLAIAEANGTTICTLDNKMHHAAAVLKIACLVP